MAIDGLASNHGDEVGIFAGNLLVGAFTVTTAGRYGLLHVYGESFPGAGDGAAQNQLLTIRIWDTSISREIAVPSSGLSSSVLGTLQQISLPPHYIGMKAGYNLNINANSIIKGDVNGDGSIDLADAIIALKAVAGISPITAVRLEGDVNGDGRIGVEEAMYVLQHLARSRSGL